MVFQENRLLADDSHVISYLIFILKFGKMSRNLLSAAVVNDALSVYKYFVIIIKTLCCREICPSTFTHCMVGNCAFFFVVCCFLSPPPPPPPPKKKKKKDQKFLSGMQTAWIQHSVRSDLGPNCL